MTIKESKGTSLNNRSLVVERLDDNCLSFHTKHNKKAYEVNFYVFSESEINELAEKQKEIYDHMEKESAKANLTNRISKFIRLLRNT